jgi:hypothetical protein
VKQGDPRDPGKDRGFSPASNVVPYEVFLRVRGRHDAAGPDPGTGKRTPALSRRPASPGGDGVGGSGAPDTRCLIDALAKLPDVRPAKVREARRRIRMGFYDRPEILEEIARRLLAEELQTDDPKGR